MQLMLEQRLIYAVANAVDAVLFIENIVEDNTGIDAEADAKLEADGKKYISERLLLYFCLDWRSEKSINSDGRNRLTIDIDIVFHKQPDICCNNCLEIAMVGKEVNKICSLAFRRGSET